MRNRRLQLPVIAFSTSLLLHATALVVLPLAIDAAAKDATRDQTATADTEPMAMPVEIELGIDAPTPPTPTWLGFEEPVPQLADLSVIEQAAFTEQPAVPSPLNPMPTAAPTPESAQTIAQQTPSPTMTESQAAEPAVAARAEPAPTSATPESPTPGPTPREVEELSDPAKRLLEEIQESLAKAVPQPKEPVQPAPQPEDAPEQQRTETAAQASPASESEVGVQSDQESSPTSVIDVPPDQWQMGKPLARPGLTIKPRRPSFALLTLMTASPGNPLCEIQFGADGVPVAAKLIHSSGDSRVDNAILASLYRWRAEGDSLKQLPRGETVDVRIRIVLTRRQVS